MIVRRREVADHVHPLLEIGQYKFQRVQKFKYLESILTKKNYELTEIKVRLHSSNKCYYRFNKSLKARTISKNLKIQL